MATYPFDFCFYADPAGPLFPGVWVVRLRGISPAAKQEKAAESEGLARRFLGAGVPLSEFAELAERDGGCGGELNRLWQKTYKYSPVPEEFFGLDAELEAIDEKAEGIADRLRVDDDALTRKMFCGCEHEGVRFGLRPEQIRGVSWLLAQHELAGGTGGCLLADDMGLGKTLQTLMFMRSVWLQKQRAGGGRFYALIVLKGSLRVVWKCEMEKWMPMEVQEMNKLVDRPTEPDDPNTPLVVFCSCKWFMEAMDVKHLHNSRKHPKRDDGASVGEPDVVVCEEATWVKGAASLTAKGKSLQHLAALKMSKRSYLLLLTGTPMENGKMSELWAYIQICRGLSSVSKYNHFAFRYCGRWFRRIGGVHGHWMDDRSSQTSELKKLMKKFMLCRKKRGRVKLPDVVYTRMDTPLTTEATQNLAAVEARFAEIRIEEGQPLTKGQADKLVREKKFLVGEQLRQSGRGKIPALKKYFEDYLDACPRRDDGKPVVKPMIIYAFHRCVFDELSQPFAERNVEVAVVRGVTTKKQKALRDQQVRKFMQAEIDVVFLSLSISEGFNFQRASVGHIVEWVWQVGKMEQAKARMVRVGQESDTVQFIRHVGLQSHGSIDDRVLVKLQEKQNTADDAIEVAAPAAPADPTPGKRRRFTPQTAL